MKKIFLSLIMSIMLIGMSGMLVEASEFVCDIHPYVEVMDNDIIFDEEEISVEDGKEISIDNASYPAALPLPTITSDQRASMIAVAKSQLGYTEADTNLTVYGEWAGCQGYSWCAAFISWCANKAEIPTTTIPKCTTVMSGSSFLVNFGNWGRFYLVNGGASCSVCSKYSAQTIAADEIQPGDIVLLETNGSVSDGPDHVGLAVATSDGSTVQIIDGNGSGNNVAQKNWSLSKVHGVCRPAYTGVTNTFTIDFEPNEMSLLAGESGVMAINFSGDGIYTLRRTIENADICSASWGAVDWSAGTATLSVSGKKEGTTKITVSLLDSNKELLYQSSFNVTVSVEKGEVIITPSTLVLNTTSNPVGTITLDATGFQSGKWVYRDYSNESIVNEATEFVGRTVIFTYTANSVGETQVIYTIKDDYDNEIGTATAKITVQQLATGITLNKSSITLNKSATYTLTATVSPSNASNKNVTWTSSNTSVATVSSSGVVTAVGKGEATITATAADGSGVKATCKVTVSQPVTGITLNKSSITLNKSATYALTATVSPSNASNQNVTWTSSNTSVATVSSSGVVMAVGKGEATITATATDGSGVKATCKVTVSQPVTSITLNKSSITLNKSATYTLTATVSPSDASNKNVTWSSSNTSVATVSSSGVITAVAKGEATITATAADGSGVKATCKVTVLQPVTSITLSPVEITFGDISKGNIWTIIATVSPSNASNKSVTWTSSNTSVATVSSSGVVTALAKGEATITATAADGSGVKATCKVTVLQPVTGITLNKSSITLNKSATYTLTATVSPSNASNKNVTWTSSNTSVATVSSSGVVTAVAKGEATITATSADGSGKSASCKVTVQQPVTGITLNQSTLTLNKATTYTLVATVSPSNANNKNVTWTSSNTAVATVSTSGVVTAVGGGEATITATAADGSGKSANCKVTVLQPVTGITLNKSAITLDKSATYTLTATISPVDATNKAVTWGSSDASVAKIDTNGMVTAVAKGEAIITAMAKDGSGVSAICKVTVVEEAEKNIFADVPENSWYYPFVKEVYNRGYMAGTGTDASGNIIFKPLANVTREQFVQILYNIEGTPAVQYQDIFPDVPEQGGSVWYSNAIMWAVENDIASGYANGLFGVGDNITREQVAVMLLKYATYKGYDTSKRAALSELKESFSDVNEIHDWAADSMCWAVKNGVMKGTAGGKLMPLGNATRAEAATMLLNMLAAYGE